MNEHKRINKLLVGYLLGELSPEQITVVQNHLAGCPQCSSELKRLKGLLECTEQIRKSSVNEQVCGAAKQTIFQTVESQETKQQTSRPYISLEYLRKTIMESPITKYSAAVAVLIICVLLGLNYFLGSTEKVYGMSDVPALFYTAKTIHMKCTEYFPERQDFENTSIELEYWLDSELGRWRMTSPSITGGLNEPLSEDLCDGSDYGMRIDHRNKQVSFVKISKFQRILINNRNLYSVLQMLCSNPDRFQEFIKTGEEILDGQTFLVWKGEFLQLSDQHDIKVQGWLSPKTGDFAKALIWIRKPDGDWKMKANVYLIERNIPISNEIFSLQKPAGYTSINTKETAQSILSPDDSSFTIDNFRIGTHLLLILPDGSLILCWSSEDTQNEISQEKLFSNLTIGGEFPTLPFQINALETKYRGQTVTYTGYHLTYTKKYDTYYEWGIYIPEKQLEPKYAILFDYILIYSNRKKPEIKYSSEGDIAPHLWIRDSQTFKEFFIGAINEFSDETAIPQTLSYQSVIQLARKLRK